MVDDGLTAQMTATLGAILAINLVFAVVVVALLEPWLAPLAAGFGLESLGARYGILTLVLLIALVWVQLRYTRRELLAEANAQPVDAESHPELHGRVTRLATQLDTTVPTVAIADTDVPNSFAVGGLRSGTIVVSDGLLETLEGDELDAVLAHELVHLRNRDAVVLTLASFLPALVSDEYALLGDDLPAWTRPYIFGALALASYVLASAFIEAPLFSIAGFAQFLIAAAVTVVVGGVALGLLATPVVFLSRRLSRQREFVADRDGARLAGNPVALASALSRIDDVATPPNEDARDRYAYRGLEGMCLLPHGFERSEAGGAEGRDDEFRVETRSHPPTEERIDRLQALAAKLERDRIE